jgi:hypothetical protein
MPLILAPDDGRPAYTRQQQEWSGAACGYFEEEPGRPTKQPYSAFSPKTTPVCGFTVM